MLRPLVMSLGLKFSTIFIAGEVLIPLGLVMSLGFNIFNHFYSWLLAQAFTANNVTQA